MIIPKFCNFTTIKQQTKGQRVPAKTPHSPDTYGHAKDFFNSQVKDGEINKQRNLKQYKNPSKSKPKINDLVIYSETMLNKYGHVSIISNVTENEIEIIQQNPGPFGNSREKYDLINENGKWIIKNDRILGWLRK